MNTEKNIILHLSLIEGIGPATIEAIINKKNETICLSELYALTAKEWKQSFGFTDHTAQKLVNGLADTTELEKELQLIECNKISWVSIECSSYPQLLKEIYLPPSILYWQGAQIDDDEKFLAVIGSRKANFYGQRIISTLIPELVAYKYTIVSGGAIGADSMAHEATVKSEGKTIVVLGSGLLCPYPYSNKKLFSTIIDKGGTIVSSFSLSTQAKPGNFPARNRIIAGLSHGCLVIQAAQQSGASITAHFALNQGREVFAVPGPVDDELSEGCHSLIQQGAKLVTGVNDILSEYGIQLVESGQREIKREVQVENGDTSLSDEQKHVVRACIQPACIDDIAEKTGLAFEEIQTVLFDLQILGLIYQDFTGMWVRK